MLSHYFICYRVLCKMPQQDSIPKKGQCMSKYTQHAIVDLEEWLNKETQQAMVGLKCKKAARLSSTMAIQGFQKVKASIM